MITLLLTPPLLLSLGTVHSYTHAKMPDDIETTARNVLPSSCTPEIASYLCHVVAEECHADAPVSADDFCEFISPFLEGCADTYDGGATALAARLYDALRLAERDCAGHSEGSGAGVCASVDKSIGEDKSGNMGQVERNGKKMNSKVGRQNKAVRRPMKAKGYDDDDEEVEVEKKDAAAEEKDKEPVIKSSGDEEDDEAGEDEHSKSTEERGGGGHEDEAGGEGEEVKEDGKKREERVKRACPCGAMVSKPATDLEEGKQKRQERRVEQQECMHEEAIVGAQASRFRADHVGVSREVFLRGVYLAYCGRNDLLEHATLKLLPGHRYGLVGRNGVGKSTLMRAIALHRLADFPVHLSSVYVQQEVRRSQRRCRGWGGGGGEREGGWKWNL